MQDFSQQNPAVVDNKKYRFYCQLKDLYQRPVFVYQSKEASPCNWRICFGWTSLHFRTYPSRRTSPGASGSSSPTARS
jgi:hypothetical protein